MLRLIRRASRLVLAALSGLATLPAMLQIPPIVRRLAVADAAALCGFYNALSDSSRRTFRPLGEHTDTPACQAVCDGNADGAKYDLIAVDGDTIVGWSFVWDLGKPEPMFGLAVADALHRQGIGRDLTRRVLEHCDKIGIPRVTLTVVIDNHRAKRIYDLAGFRDYGQFRQDSDGLDYFRMERFKPIAGAPG